MKTLDILRFGFDLKNIEQVQEYLIDNYTEDVDFEIFIERGEDVMNACIMKFDYIKDGVLLGLIMECDGEGDWDDM